MTDRVAPTSPVSPADRRAAERRRAERRADDQAGSAPGRDLVPLGRAQDHTPTPDHTDGPASPAARPAPTADPAGSPAAFAAQMMGQSGQRKGIKGGPPVMDAARATYLNAEYSGDKERRPPIGKAKRTDI